MAHLKPMRLAGAVVILAGMPLLTGSAQAQVQTPPSPNAQVQTPASPNAQVQTPASPNAQVQTPPSPSATRPSAGADTPATAPRRTDKSATAPGKTNPLVGLAVFSSDGNKMGTVHSVSAAPDGSVKAIHIKTGGFLGFGGKLVAIPEGRFTKSGDNIQLGISADEVSKLPEMKEQS
jgi:hypothetical protein